MPLRIVFIPCYKIDLPFKFRFILIITTPKIMLHDSKHAYKCNFFTNNLSGVGNLRNTRSKLSFKCLTTLEIGKPANRGSYSTTLSRF